MRSYWLEQNENGTTLSLRTVDIPKIVPGQILVKMRAVGLNRGEFIARKDLHGKPGISKPSGNEGAGEVVEVAPNVANFKIGDRVMGVCGGAFSEFAVMDSKTAINVPDCLSWEEAACTPLTFLVVHDMLIAQGHLKAGEWVLVAGASSGVGVAAIQAAAALGAHTIGTSRSEPKLAKLRQIGLEIAIRSGQSDFRTQVMDATKGKGANLIINAVGGTVFPDCLRSLAFEGRLATVGYVDGQSTPQCDIALIHANRLVIFGVSALLRTPEQRAETVRGFTADILPFISSGRIKIEIDRIFSFNEMPMAKAHMESNAHVGKIAVRVT